jgi:CBS domain containing-hemolysin-like protein
MDSILKLLAIFALVAVNGIFVAAEFALVSVRPTRIDQLVADGNRWARLVKRAMADPNRFISAAQVGITMASLGLGWLAEPAIAELLIPIFDPILGEDSTIGAHLVSAIIALFIVTLLHIVLGEQVPKMIALQRSESTILAITPVVSAIAVPFRPLIAILYWLTAIVLDMLGLKWEGEQHLVYSEDELKLMITASHQRGILDENEEAMINRVFGFAEITTDQVMVPRTEIESIPIDLTLDEVTARLAETGHSRYPVYGENIDDIRGVFHAKDLFRLYARNEEHRFNLRRMMRVPLMVSESTNLDDLLQRMKRERTQVAIVVDEYGGTAGMVTLEDVLERIIGDVQDEFETDGDDVAVDDAAGTSTVSGLLSLPDINELFNLELEDPYYNSIGGYVFGQLGRRPEIGDEIAANGVTLTVAKLDGLRIDRILINRLPVEYTNGTATPEPAPTEITVP